ncbi:MAG: hypothetical protein L0H59_06015 [Tomitella sp.]|nr:hypothetical protein [Tomitella sp.]
MGRHETVERRPPSHAVIAGEMIRLFGERDLDVLAPHIQLVVCRAPSAERLYLEVLSWLVERIVDTAQWRIGPLSDDEGYVLDVRRGEGAPVGPGELPVVWDHVLNAVRSYLVGDDRAAHMYLTHVERSGASERIEALTGVLTWLDALLVSPSSSPPQR